MLAPVLLIAGVAAAQDAAGDPPLLRSGASLVVQIEQANPALREVRTEALAALGPAVGVRLELEVERSGTHHLVLESHFADAYLVLRDPSGAIVGEDDDGGLGTHSQLVFEASPGEPLFVEACALRDGRGPAEVVLRAGAPERLGALALVEAQIEDARGAVAALEARFGPDHARLEEPLNRLGYWLWRRGRFGEALPVMQRLLAIVRQEYGDDSARTAGALFQVAAQLEGLARLDEAEPLYREALEIWEALHGPDSLQVARALNALAELLRATGDFEEALPYYERALGIRDEQLSPDDPQLAGSMNNLALALQALGDLEEARALFETALAINEAAHGDEHRETATTLNNLAGVLTLLGEHREARRLYERALALRERLLGPDHRITIRTLVSMTNLMLILGDYEEARLVCERALAAQQRALGPAHPDIALSTANLAQLLLKEGETGRARRMLEHAIELRESRGDGRSHLPNLYCYLARARELEGDDEPALLLYERALELQEPLRGLESHFTALVLNNQALILHRRGSFDAAQAKFESSLAILEELPGAREGTRSTVLCNLAELHKATGSYEQARDGLRLVAAIRERRIEAGRSRTITALHNLVHLEVELGNESQALELALELCDQGGAWLERQLCHAPTERRFALAGEQACWLNHLSSCLAFLDAPADRLDDVWSRFTAWQGLVFRSADRIRRGGPGRVARPQIEAARARLRSIDRALAEHAYARRIPDAERHRAEFEALRADQDLAERELLDALALAPEGRRTSARELGALLPEGSALLDFTFYTPLRAPELDERGELWEPPHWDAPRVQCWIVRAGEASPRLVDLGEQRVLQERVERYLESIAPGLRGVPARPASPTDDVGASLRETLWRPLEAQLSGVQTLVVVPEGFLAELPFGSIPLGEGRYLLELADVVYAQDPVTLSERLQREPIPRTSAPTLLAVGAVQYGSSVEQPDEAASAEPDAAGNGLRGFSRHWGPLPYTGDEIAAVLALHGAVFEQADPPQRLSGAEATEERFEQLAPGHTVVHLATHGFFEREGLASLWEAAMDAAREDEAPGIGAALGDLPGVLPPLRGTSPELLAGLVLAGVNAPAGGGRLDGVLTAAEVGGLVLEGCELAVLSACQTALGTGRSGEGLLSLRRAFREAGAATVIATLWKVDDEATRELLTRFYEELWRNGQSPSAALRTAQLSLLRGGRFQDPAYWAAFTLSGEWR